MAKARREGISKKTRFEVFKRDKFTCQYCGAKAPDVILHVDHIQAVAAGGKSDILNLLTSCAPCNGGKGARPLEQNAELDKQRAQMEELEERRQQIEMLLEWRNGLSDLKTQQLDAIVNRICDEFEWGGLTEAAKNLIRKWLLKYSVTEILDCFEISVTQYLQFDSKGHPLEESKSKAFAYVPRIASVQRGMRDIPWLQDRLYTLGILKNRMYVGQPEATNLIDRAFRAGAGSQVIKQVAKTAKNWTYWREDMIGLINDLEAVEE